MERRDSELLKAARALIDAPEKWMKYTFRNGETRETSTAFCSVGALIHAGWDCAPQNVIRYLNAAGGMHIMLFNDTHNHHQVMAVWDKAIANAEKWEREHGLWPEKSWTMEDTRRFIGQMERLAEVV